VGRLDVATSGLLLVTNDGDFAQKVSHPSYGLTKEYVVTVTEKVSKRQVQLIAQGTKVQGVQCVPTQVELLDAAEPGDARHRIRIEVCEGRNHEVRQLVANAGLEVQGLKRVRIGGLRLSRKLAAGKYEVLTETQVNKVMEKPV
jgi:pseudouridine synthase